MPPYADMTVKDEDGNVSISIPVTVRNADHYNQTYVVTLDGVI